MRLKKWMFLTLLLVGFSNIYAVNYHWLYDTAVHSYSESEVDQMYDNVTSLLDQGNVGDSQSWKGDSPEHYGSAKILSTDDGATPCRIVNVINRAINFSGNHDYKFCQQSTGDWKVITMTR